MESWIIGYDGNSDAERHAGVEQGRARPLRLRVVSDYI